MPAGWGSELRGRLVAAAAVVALLASYREELAGRALAPLVGLTSTATAVALNALGVPTEQQGGSLASPNGFAYEIYFRCTGYLPSALLAIGILTTRAPGRRKLVGLVLGVLALLTLNLLRLVHLFLVGVARPDLFALAHDVLWEGAIVLAVLGLLCGWKRWATMNVSLPGSSPEGAMGRNKIGEFGCLMLGAFVGLLGEGAPALSHPADTEATQEEARMGRDEGYRRLFTILDSAEAALKQQPANLAAQAEYLRDLEATLQSVRTTPREQPSPKEPATPSVGAVAGQAAAAPPSGPVPPSTRPSRPEDEQRRREATAKLRAGGPLGRPYGDRTLRGVPDGWLLPACDRALARSRELRERLARGRVEPESIVAGLRDVRAAVQEIGSPAGPRN